MSIKSVGIACYEQSQAKNKELRKLGNAVVTGVGLAGTTALLLKGVQVADRVCGDKIALSNGSKIFRRDTGKVFKLFEKMGEKLFGDKTFVGKAIKRYVTGETASGGHLANPKQIAAFVKKYKTVGAMGLAAGIVSLALIVRGAFKAGKITGDN